MGRRGPVGNCRGQWLHCTGVSGNLKALLRGGETVIGRRGMRLQWLLSWQGNHPQRYLTTSWGTLEPGTTDGGARPATSPVKDRATRMGSRRNVSHKTEVRIERMVVDQAQCMQGKLRHQYVVQSTVGRKVLREMRDRQVWNVELLNSSRLG